MCTSISSQTLTFEFMSLSMLVFSPDAGHGQQAATPSEPCGHRGNSSYSRVLYLSTVMPFGSFTWSIFSMLSCIVHILIRIWSHGESRSSCGFCGPSPGRDTNEKRHQVWLQEMREDPSAHKTSKAGRDAEHRDSS